MNGRILLKGGCVLTLGQRTQNYHEADVLIEDGRISEVGPGLRARGAEQFDAADTIVMPGFVDTHRHSWRSLFRNFGESPTTGNTATPDVYGAEYRPEDVYAGALIGLLGAVSTGITSVVDWIDVPSGREFVEAALQAHADAGLRTVQVHSAPHWSEEASSVAALEAIREPRRTDLNEAAYGSADVLPANVEAIASDWSAARSAGVRIHARAGTDRAAAGAVANLGDLLGPDVTLVHCSHLSDQDLDAVSSQGARVSITPSSEMAEGLGSPPIQKLIDRSIRPGLGVDNERVAPGDMFAQMRVTNSIQHATMFDLKLSGKAGLPTLLTTREVIKYATIDGANAAGLGDTVGSLEVGKRADIIVLRTDRPNIAPINDPIGAVVWGMDTSNIDWVFVAGTPLMQEGKLLADVNDARRRAIDSQNRVAQASGLLAAAGGAG